MSQIVRAADTKTARQRTNQRATQGRVVSVDASSGTCALDVGWEDTNGATVLKEGVPYSPQTPPAVGDTVTLHYQNDSPHSAVVSAGQMGGQNATGEVTVVGGVSSLRKSGETAGRKGDITLAATGAATWTRAGNVFTLDVSLGTIDHGSLAGLGDDDHTQYHTDARGDARYYLKSQVDTFLAAKAALVHTHALSALTASGAASGQVPTWNGSAWVPQTPSSGGGSTAVAIQNDGAVQGTVDTLNLKPGLEASVAGTVATVRARRYGQVWLSGGAFAIASDTESVLLGWGGGITTPSDLYLPPWSEATGTILIVSGDDTFYNLKVAPGSGDVMNQVLISAGGIVSGLGTIAAIGVGSGIQTVYATPQQTTGDWLIGVP